MKRKAARNGDRLPDGRVLGLHAFEQISAVEGIHVSPELKRDLQALDRQGMSALERSRFIAEKYGKPSAS